MKKNSETRSSNFRDERHNLQTTLFEKEKVMRHKRSRNYIDAIEHLDTGSQQAGAEKLDDIYKIIRMELPGLFECGELVALLCKCYLGKAYDVHTIDLAGGILYHFKKGEGMPDGFEKARSLLMFGSYRLIEIYTTCYCAIDDNGFVAVIKK